MPHDIEGRIVNVGDLVRIDCIVKRVELGEDYCNVTLETISEMYPSGTATTITLNARQVRLFSSAEERRVKVMDAIAVAAARDKEAGT
jgi:hypothetical protein